MPRATTPVLEPTEVDSQDQELDQDSVADKESEVSVEEELGLEEDTEDAEFYEGEEDYEAGDDSPFGVWSAETAANKPLKVLLYGPSGAGKTRYAATFPKPLFLDLEGGLRSTVQVGPVLRFPPNSQDEITNVSQVGQFYDLVKVYRPDNAPFQTIVIDSLNELQVLVTKKVLGTYPATRQMEDQLTWQDYGKIGRDVLKIIGLFLKLPFHIVFTAVETIREYEGQEVHPRFSGKMVWPELQRWMEQIGYCHVIKGANGDPEHVVSYKLAPQYIAKTRLQINERLLPNNYAALAKYVPQS